MLRDFAQNYLYELTGKGNLIFEKLVNDNRIDPNILFDEELYDIRNTNLDYLSILAKSPRLAKSNREKLEKLIEKHKKNVKYV